MFVIYLYDVNGDPITQITNPINVDVEQNLNSYDLATFSIPGNHPACNSLYLQDYNEVKINMFVDGEENEMFHGVIAKKQASLSKVTVYCRSYERLLGEKKIIDALVTYTGQTVAYIVADLLGTINSRYDTGITLSCDVTDTINLQVAAGATFMTPLQEIVKAGYEFRIIDKVLTVSSQIGDDKSTGPDLVLLKRDINESSDRSVRDAIVEEDADQIVNAAWNINVGFDTDPTSISTYGRIEETVVTNVSAAEVLADTLAKKKDSEKQISIYPNINNFFFANIGDIVKVYIDAGNDIMFYDGTAKIVQKTYDQSGSTAINVSRTTVKSMSFEETFVSYGKRIKKLEI